MAPLEPGSGRAYRERAPPYAPPCAPAEHASSMAWLSLAWLLSLHWPM